MALSSSKPQRVALTTLLIAAIFVFSYFREHVFLGINNVIRHDLASPGSMFESLLSVSQTNLSIIKWVLTIIFAMGIATLTYFSLNIIFYPKKHFKIVLYSFSALLALSFFCVATGYIFSSYENGYYLARVIMGLTQNPVILFVLIPAIKLTEK